MGPIYGASHADQLIHGAQAAVKNGSTHLGIIEHDHRFPADAFVRLRERDLPIVGANYRQRQRLAWAATTETQTIGSRGRTGVEPVLTVGMGVWLCKIEVLKALPMPWFSNEWSDIWGRHSTCDVHFGRYAAAHGFQSYVDHDLSQEVGHIAGDIELHMDRLVFTQTGETMLMLPEEF